MDGLVRTPLSRFSLRSRWCHRVTLGMETIRTLRGLAESTSTPAVLPGWTAMPHGDLANWLATSAPNPCQTFTSYGGRPGTSTLSPIRHITFGTIEFIDME